MGLISKFFEVPEPIYGESSVLFQVPGPWYGRKVYMTTRASLRSVLRSSGSQSHIFLLIFHIFPHISTYFSIFFTSPVFLNTFPSYEGVEGGGSQISLYFLRISFIFLLHMFVFLNMGERARNFSNKSFFPPGHFREEFPRSNPSRDVTFLIPGWSLFFQYDFAWLCPDFQRFFQTIFSPSKISPQKKIVLNPNAWWFSSVY